MIEGFIVFSFKRTLEKTHVYTTVDFQVLAASEASNVRRMRMSVVSSEFENRIRAITDKSIRLN